MPKKPISAPPVSKPKSKQNAPKPTTSTALQRRRASGPVTRVEIVAPATVLPATSSLNPTPPEFDPLARMEREGIYFGGLGLATAPFAPEQTQVLLTPAQDQELDILPTGEVYMSGVHVRRRLWAAFGPGGWGQRPRSLPQQQGDTIAQYWELVVLGRSVDTTWGEAEYQPDNRRMSYPTALEAAKTNALTRSCKTLGIASECWDRRFCEDYKRRCCVKVHRHAAKSQDRAWQWRRIDAAPFYDEDQVDDRETSPQNVQAWREQRARARAYQDDQDGRGYAEEPVRSDPRPPAVSSPQLARGGFRTPSGDQRPISDGQKNRLWAIMRSAGVSKEVLYYYLSEKFPYTADPEKGGAPSAAKITRQDYDAVCDWVQKGAK